MVELPRNSIQCLLLYVLPEQDPGQNECTLAQPAVNGIYHCALFTSKAQK